MSAATKTSAAWPAPKPIAEAARERVTEIMGWCPGYGWRHLYQNQSGHWVGVGTSDIYEPVCYVSMPPDLTHYSDACRDCGSPLDIKCSQQCPSNTENSDEA